MLLFLSVMAGTSFILETPLLEQKAGLAKAATYSFIMSACSLSMGVYLSYSKEGFAAMALRTVVSFCLLGAGLLTIAYYILPELYLGRGVLFWSTLLSTVLVLSARWLFFHTVNLSRIKRRVVLLGTGKQAKNILDNLGKERSGFDVEIFCCFNDENSAIQVPQSLVKPYPKDWAQYIRQHKISEVVVAPDERRRSKGGSFPEEGLLECKMAGVIVSDVLSFFEREMSKVEVNLLHSGWLLFSDGFKYSRSRDIGKRAFDIVTASLLVLALSPLLLLTSAVILLGSGRPILYSQLRVGLNGKIFRIYKFRSMRNDAEKNGAVWASKNDSRVTKVGAFLRNTRIDELPQLYNVLKGEMSFVGPRPERPEFVEELSKQIPFYDSRHRTKPGLMGWAQLNYPYGASVEDAKGKLRYDLYYMKNHSMMIDLLIMVQTIEVVLLGDGAR
ncbi:TIGR03013 family XrtA/PEP-CTERM system glycosyltransferase [Porticoccus sp. GXU_MW_L64]